MTTQDHELDELLEKVWLLQEDGKAEESALDPAEFPPGLLERAEQGGLLSRRHGRLGFSSSGEAAARLIIRRHRLAEVLFSQVLEVPEEEQESQACEFEHVLSEAVTDRICTFLGHPEFCPHQKAIPKGKCCAEYRKVLQPLVSRLSLAPVGAEGRVVMMNPKYHSRLDRLQSLGIAPGAKIRLHQKKPAVVVQVDETTVALDPDIAEEIFMRIEKIG